MGGGVLGVVNFRTGWVSVQTEAELPFREAKKYRYLSIYPKFFFALRAKNTKISLFTLRNAKKIFSASLHLSYFKGKFWYYHFFVLRVKKT